MQHVACIILAAALAHCSAITAKERHGGADEMESSDIEAEMMMGMAHGRDRLDKSVATDIREARASELVVVEAGGTVVPPTHTSTQSRDALTHEVEADGRQKLVRTKRSPSQMSMDQLQFQRSSIGLEGDNDQDAATDAGQRGIFRTPMKAKSQSNASLIGESTQESDLVAGQKESLHNLVRTPTKADSRGSADLEEVMADEGDTIETTSDGKAAAVQTLIAYLRNVNGKFIIMGSLGGVWLTGLLIFCCTVNSGSRMPQSDAEPLLSPTLPRQEPRGPSKKMKMEMKIKVLNAEALPALPGIIDPYVEISCVKGDPKTRRGGISDVSQAKARTHSRQNDDNPVWNEAITLSKVVYGQEYFINIVLWQSNESTGNSPIGYHSMELSKFISELQYDPQSDVIPTKDFAADNFISLLADQYEVLPSVVNLSVGYVEMHKFTVSVASATSLPAEPKGQLDSYVEIRIVHGDHLKQEYHSMPHDHDTVWHGRTKTVHGSSNPTFNDEINFILAANPDLYMIFCVTDAGNLTHDERNLAATPMGITVVPLKQVVMNRDGFKESFDRSLEKLPNWTAPDKLTDARLNFSISHKLSVSNT